MLPLLHSVRVASPRAVAAGELRPLHGAGSTNATPPHPAARGERKAQPGKPPLLKQVARLSMPRWGTWTFAFFKGGRWICAGDTGSARGQLYLWNPWTGKRKMVDRPALRQLPKGAKADVLATASARGSRFIAVIYHIPGGPCFLCRIRPETGALISSRIMAHGRYQPIVMLGVANNSAIKPRSRGTYIITQVGHQIRVNSVDGWSSHRLHPGYRSMKMGLVNLPTPPGRPHRPGWYFPRVGRFNRYKPLHGLFLATINNGHRFTVWNLTTYRRIFHGRTESPLLDSIAISRLGILAIGTVHRILFFRIDARKYVGSIRMPFAVQALSFSRDGKLLAAGASTLERPGTDIIWPRSRLFVLGSRHWGAGSLVVKVLARAPRIQGLTRSLALTRSGYLVQAIEAPHGLGGLRVWKLPPGVAPAPAAAGGRHR